MSDNTSISGSPDRDRISISEDYKVRYRSEKFGVSKGELIDAMKASVSIAFRIFRYDPISKIGPYLKFCFIINRRENSFDSNNAAV